MRTIDAEKELLTTYKVGQLVWFIENEKVVSREIGESVVEIHTGTNNIWRVEYYKMKVGYNCLPTSLLNRKTTFSLSDIFPTKEALINSL